MAFTTGLGHPTMLSRTNYYINTENPGTPINQWDPNTFLFFSFDSSGSMGTIIPVIKNVVDCTYCASGSAAGGDCVKATNCLRCDLQDFYATGGIEGAPDYNANDATNGKDDYEAHVGYRIVGDEQFLTWFQNYYPARNTTSAFAAFANHTTWEAFGSAKTVNNLMFITVGNEAGPSGASQHYNKRYHRNLFGGPETAVVTATVNGATTNAAAFTSTESYGDDGAGLENEKLTSAGNLGHATDNDGIGTGSDNAFRMFLTARSSGGAINGTPYITACSGTGVTLSTTHSFVDGETLTFTLFNPGIDMTAAPMPNYKTDVRQMRESLTLGTNVDYSDGLHDFATYSPGKGLSGIKATSGQEPSIHWVHIDPGGTDGARITNGTNSNKPHGPKANNGNAPFTSYTGPQRHAVEGTKQGIGIYGNDSGTNHSLNDWNALISPWNGKFNTFSVIPLINESANASQTFWYNEIKNAISIGITI